MMTQQDIELLSFELLQKLRLSDEDIALSREAMDNLFACMSELERVGIDTDMRKPLIRKAGELYLKWQWDYLGKGERFEKCFNDLRDALSLTQSYLERDDRDGDE
ncbi:MAG: hypothetical protein IJU51_03625 [Clostridia bacterium]|nr:hypothetical protein [Clostridia bacterium]